MADIYLDHGATTAVDQRVLDAMMPYFTERFGNASSLHGHGQKAHDALAEARTQVAALINAHDVEIVFTSSGTEADNLAIKGVAFHHLHNRKTANGRAPHIITSNVEHPAVLRTFEYLESLGLDATYLKVDGEGLVSPSDVERAMRPETILVSVMHANNEIGTVQDIRAIGAVVRKRGALMHTDAVQALGKVPIDVADMNVDLLSMSAHKLHGPKGVGALYVRNGVTVEPLLHGGGHEFGRRSSTENVPGIVGFGRACELARQEMAQETGRMAALRDRMINGILERIPDSYLNGHPTRRLPNNVNVSIRFVEGESMLLSLDAAGISVSTGSACSSKSLKASHVLTAIGLRPEEAHGSLRITLGRFTTRQDVDRLLEALPPIVARLRSMSPLASK